MLYAAGGATAAASADQRWLRRGCAELELESRCECDRKKNRWPGGMERAKLVRRDKLSLVVGLQPRYVARTDTACFSLPMSYLSVCPPDRKKPHRINMRVLLVARAGSAWNAGAPLRNWNETRQSIKNGYYCGLILVRQSSFIQTNSSQLSLSG